MKKIRQIMLYSFLPLLFLSRGCAEDADETYDADNSPEEVNFAVTDVVSKDMAIENWEMFLKQSQELIAISETNIGSLEVKIDDTYDAEKIGLQGVFNAGNLALLKLKARRLKRNEAFTSELANYDASVQPKNEAFKKKFKSDMLDLNNTIEAAIEKSKSGD